MRFTDRRTDCQLWNDADWLLSDSSAVREPVKWLIIIPECEFDSQLSAEYALELS